MKSLRIVAVAAAAVIAGLLVSATPVQADDAIVTHRFSANSGDNCQYGVTSGQLGWHYSSPPRQLIAIHVTGALVDRPTSNDPISCRDDRYSSVATFVAYAGSIVIDRDARRADNAAVDFRFTLGSNTAAARIDWLVVQVCRQPVGAITPIYCGQTVTYPAPIIP